MTEQVQTSAGGALPTLWGRWTRIVAACAGRKAPAGVTLASYPRLYQEVVEACRAAAASSNGAERELYGELERLVLPWVTLEVLARTDRDMLAGLLGRCRDAGRRLKGRKPWTQRHWSLPPGALFLVALLLSVTAVTFALDWWPPSLTSHLESQARAAWDTWRGLGTSGQVLLMAVVVVLLGIALLGRLVRKK